MKSFKRFFYESDSSEVFNSFVENTLSSNVINATSANDFLNPEFNYLGIIYKVIFCPASEVQNLFSEDNVPNRKAIASYLVKKFNPNRYVFFCKTLRGVLNLIKYPGLFNIEESQIGVVYSQKSPSSIDLTKYQGKNIEVKKRLGQTQEVLSFEDLTITNISALYYFGEEGWEMETELNRPIVLGKGAEKEEEGTEEPPEAETEEQPEDQTAGVKPEDQQKEVAPKVRQ